MTLVTLRRKRKQQTYLRQLRKVEQGSTFRTNSLSDCQEIVRLLLNGKLRCLVQKSLP
jgi:hypothetical protein